MNTFIGPSVRRGLMAAALVGALTSAFGGAHAADAARKYPTRPVHVIVGFAAGGLTDVVARLLGQKLSESLGQPFVIENRPGASSNIAMALVAKAPPDGYTLLAMSSSFVVNPSLYGDKITYDPYKDFEPITDAATSPTLLLVNPHIISAKTAQELIEFLHGDGAKYGIGTPGIGTISDLAAELFRMKFKLDAVRVPFNGNAPALASCLQGQTPVVFSTMPSATDMVKQGQLRALAITSGRRSPVLPDVPTMAEAGIPDQTSDTIMGFMAPAGTPKEIVTRLYTEIVKIEAQPDMKRRLAALGFDPLANTPEEFTAQIREQIAKWGTLIREAHIKM